MKSSKLRRFTFAIITIFTISILAYILGWSTLLTVKSVTITGTNSESTITNELAQKDLHLTVGMKLARVDLRGIKSTLASMDWLDSYQVDRNWVDGGITLAITEKTGIAKAISKDGSTVLFDFKGKIFKPVSMVQLKSEESLPLVNLSGNSPADLQAVAKLLQSISADQSDLISNLQGITVGSTGSIKMSTQITGRRVEISWGGAENAPQKIKVLRALLALPENKGATKFDLSIPDSPIVS